MATSSREWNPQVLIEREDREVVLAVITASPSITIEELLHHLPWMRWGVSLFHTWRMSARRVGDLVPKGVSI